MRERAYFVTSIREQSTKEDCRLGVRSNNPRVILLTYLDLKKAFPPLFLAISLLDNHNLDQR